MYTVQWVREERDGRQRKSRILRWETRAGTNWGGRRETVVIKTGYTWFENCACKTDGHQKNWKNWTLVRREKCKTWGVQKHRYCIVIDYFSVSKVFFPIAVCSSKFTRLFVCIHTHSTHMYSLWSRYRVPPHTHSKNRHNTCVMCTQITQTQ